MMMDIVRAQKEHFHFYYELKCEASAIYWGGFSSPPSYEKLYNHFLNIIESESIMLFFIIDEQKNLVGYFQLSQISETEMRIGYEVSEAYRGKGYGTYAVSKALELCHNQNAAYILAAYIAPDNIASVKCFEKNGFISQDAYKLTWFQNQQRDLPMVLFLDPYTSVKYKDSSLLILEEELYQIDLVDGTRRFTNNKWDGKVKYK